MEEPFSRENRRRRIEAATLAGLLFGFAGTMPARADWQRTVQVKAPSKALALKELSKNKSFDLDSRLCMKELGRLEVSTPDFSILYLGTEKAELASFLVSCHGGNHGHSKDGGDVSGRARG